METFRPWPATVIRSYYEHPPDSGYLCVDVGDKVSVLCAQAPGAMSLLTFLRVLSICVRCHWMLPAQWFKNAHGCGVTSFNTSVHQPRRFLFGILCIIIFRNFSYSILLLPSSCTSEIMFWISSCFGSKPSARIAAFTFSGSIEPQLSVSKRCAKIAFVQADEDESTEARSFVLTFPSRPHPLPQSAHAPAGSVRLVPGRLLQGRTVSEVYFISRTCTSSQVGRPRALRPRQRRTPRPRAVALPSHFGWAPPFGRCGGMARDGLLQ